MLPCSFSDREILQLPRTRPADRNPEFVGGAFAPPLTLRRDARERDFDAIRIDACLAETVNQRRLQCRFGSAIEQDLPRLAFPPPDISLLFQAHAGAPKLIIQLLVNERLFNLKDQEHPAPRPADRQTPQPLHRRVAEVGRKSGDENELILLGDLPRLEVVLGDGRILVAEIHLDDFLHVLVELPEPCLDLGRLRPDAAVDHGILVVRQMHQPGEIPPQPHRIDDGEGDLPRRPARKQPQGKRIHGIRRRGHPTFQQDRAVLRKTQSQGDLKELGQLEAPVLRQNIRPVISGDPERCKGNHLFRFGRRLPLLRHCHGPFGKPRCPQHAQLRQLP